METRENNRKHYKKPQVSQVKLEIEDAVLVNCKSDTGATTGVKNDKICSAAPACKKAPFGS